MARSDGSEVALAALRALVTAADAPSAAAALSGLDGVDRTFALPDALGGGTLGALLEEAAAGLSGAVDPQTVADALSARLGLLDALADAESAVAHAEAADVALAGLTWQASDPIASLPEPSPLPDVTWTFDLDD